MSIALPAIDLTGVVVGSTGTISLKNTGYTADPSFTKNQAQLKILNESGAGLQITTRLEGHSIYIPAGAWVMIGLIPGESNVDYVVIYLITNPPVSQLLAIYYAPNEPVDNISTLGNSPVGGAISSGGGGIATQVINDGNPATVHVVESTLQSSIASNVTIDNTGGMLLAQYVSGIFTQLFRVIIGVATGLANTNVQLGDSNHQTEVIGSLLVDAYSHFMGTVNGTTGGPGVVFNSVPIDGGGVGYTAQPANTATNYIDFQAIGVNTNAGIGYQAQGNMATAFDTTLINLGTTAFKAGVNSTPGLDLSLVTSAGNGIKFSGGTLTRIKFGFTAIGTTATAVTHGLGTTPQVVLITNGSGGSGGITYQATSIGATTFSVTPTPATATNVFWLAASA